MAVEFYNTQFRFVLSNGEKSEVPWTGRAGDLIRIEPAGSEVSKILVNYDQTTVVYGIKLFDREGKCVL